MTRCLLSLLLCSFLLISCKEEKSTKTDEKSAEIAQKSETSKWETLFNGTDLNGWTMKIAGYELGENFGNTFRVSDSILSIRYGAYGKNFNERFGALYYKEEFTNYRLKVEYRFVGETAPGGPEWGYRDSGVQYQSQPPATVKLDQQFPICLEYNLLGGNGTDERPVGDICANGILFQIDGQQNTTYCTPPTVKRTFHGDQWVTLEIDVKDGVISHFINGEKILTYNNPEYDPSNEIAKTLIKNGDPAVKSGYISLQSNSHPIDFRKIEIMRY